jgi:hypothetical protein
MKALANPNHRMKDLQGRLLDRADIICEYSLGNLCTRQLLGLVIAWTSLAIPMQVNQVKCCILNSPEF